MEEVHSIFFFNLDVTAPIADEKFDFGTNATESVEKKSLEVKWSQSYN